MLCCVQDTLRVYGSRAPRNVFLFERALVISKPVQRARAGDSSPLDGLPGIRADLCSLSGFLIALFAEHLEQLNQS